MAIGIIGIEMFQAETQGTLSQGETLTLKDYTIRYDGLSVFDGPDGRNITRAVVSVFKDGEYLTELYPRRDFYYDSNQPMTIPGVRSTIEDDFYILMVDWQEIESGVTIEQFELGNMPARLREHGDLWKPLLSQRGRFSLGELVHEA